MVIEAFNDDSSRSGRALTWITHRSGYALAAYAVLCVVGWLFQAPPWLDIPASIVVVLTTMATTVAMFHFGFTRLCIACMQEVPVDASSQAQKRRWSLRFQHVANHWASVPALLVLCFGPLIAMPYMPAWFSHIAWAPMEVWTVANLYSLRIHHRLRPWCPWCKDWGEGGDIKEPSPDPANQKTLTA